LAVAGVSTLVHFAVSSVKLTATVAMTDGREFVLDAGAVQGGFRTGNIDDLSYFRGYLLTSGLELKAKDAKFLDAVKKQYFNAAIGGAQIVADVQSVSELERPLTVGAALETTVVGRLQVGERLQPVTFPARVTREANDVLHVVNTAPIVLPISAFGRAPEIAAVGAAIAGEFAPDIKMNVDLRLEPHQASEIPAYVRTGVSVQTVQEIQAEAAPAAGELTPEQARMLERGAPPAFVQAMTPQAIDASRIARERELARQRMDLGMGATREERTRDPGLRVMRPADRGLTGPPPVPPAPPDPAAPPPGGAGQVLVPPQPAAP
jgi:hypothetical protein